MTVHNIYVHFVEVDNTLSYIIYTPWFKIFWLKGQLRVLAPQFMVIVTVNGGLWSIVVHIVLNNMHIVDYKLRWMYYLYY